MGFFEWERLERENAAMWCLHRCVRMWRGVMVDQVRFCCGCPRQSSEAIVRGERSMCTHPCILPVPGHDDRIVTTTESSPSSAGSKRRMPSTPRTPPRLPLPSSYLYQVACLHPRSTSPALPERQDPRAGCAPPPFSNARRLAVPPTTSHGLRPDLDRPPSVWVPICSASKPPSRSVLPTRQVPPHPLQC